MLLGLKADSILKKFGWGSDIGSDWDAEGTVDELRSWQEQGFEVVEITAGMSSQTGAFFRLSKNEWRRTKVVIEDAGLHIQSILAWRRMICPLFGWTLW